MPFHVANDRLAIASHMDSLFDFWFGLAGSRPIQRMCIPNFVTTFFSPFPVSHSLPFFLPPCILCPFPFILLPFSLPRTLSSSSLPPLPSLSSLLFLLPPLLLNSHPPYQPHLCQRWLLRRILYQNSLRRTKCPQVRIYYSMQTYQFGTALHMTSFTRPFLFPIASNKAVLEAWKWGYLHICMF